MGWASMAVRREAGMGWTGTRLDRVWLGYERGGRMDWLGRGCSDLEQLCWHGRGFTYNFQTFFACVYILLYFHLKKSLLLTYIFYFLFFFFAGFVNFLCEIRTFFYRSSPGGFNGPHANHKLILY